MEQYTISEYRNKFMSDKCHNTVWRRCRENSLPKGHIPILKCRTYIINVSDCRQINEDLEPYLLAIREYVSVLGIPCNLELTTEIGIKFNVPRQRLLNEILGFKQI